MFERRLKILLALLVLFTGFLATRAAQVQILQRDYWKGQATELMKRFEFVETTRGRIVDRKGREVAADLPCIDACVDYRVIGEEPDEAWVKARAERNLQDRLQDTYRKVRRSKQWKPLLDAEMTRVKSDVQLMWGVLAKVSGKTPEEIDEVRHDIIRRVEMRRRYVWWRSYQIALKKQGTVEQKKWYESLMGGGDDANGPKLDDFSVEVAEQSQSHVILRAVNADQHNELAKNLERYPGLSLVPSKHRVYPFGETACHVMGHLAAVSREDILADRASDPDPADPDADPDPAASKDRRELRKYWPNDLIGKAGIEALCEKTLRGARGRITRSGSSDDVIEQIDPLPGRDVRLSIDMELQSDVEQAFAQHRETILKRADHTTYTEVREKQHGAAVVIDVKTGEVLSLVSYPGFDPNQFDNQYAVLVHDDLNQPLTDRATQMALEPGSSVKTIVGSGGITHGYIGKDDTIECTGFLVLNGRRYGMGRCWVASQFLSILGPGGVAHHQVPYNDPHPTGFLTTADALERSCNVFFETLADRMGMRELVFWFDKFGLGRPTGVGIEEASGAIPEPQDAPQRSPMRLWTWFAGIGQGMVRATPMQMANVAATLARGGIWVRPHLVANNDVGRLTTRPSATPVEQVDLHLAPDAVAAVRAGMIAVTTAGAGTGKDVHPQHASDVRDPLDGMVVAAKTGSAQAPQLSMPDRDDAGDYVRENGRIKRHFIPLGTKGTETWYLGVGDNQDHLAHAWYIGYAPAENPQVAFCVMVEYGGAGGRVAGAIAHDVLAACIRHGYLANPAAAPAPAPVASGN